MIDQSLYIQIVYKGSLKGTVVEVTLRTFSIRQVELAKRTFTPVADQVRTILHPPMNVSYDALLSMSIVYLYMFEAEE